MRGRVCFLALLGGITLLSSVATFELLGLVVGGPEQVPVAPPLEALDPTADSVRVVPTPALQPASPIAAMPTPAATPTPAAGKIFAQVRGARSAFLRAAPRLAARLVLEPPPDDTRGQQLELRAFAHEDRSRVGVAQ